MKNKPTYKPLADKRAFHNLLYAMLAHRDRIHHEGLSDKDKYIGRCTMIPRSLVEQMAAFFGEDSYSAQALKKARAIGEDARIVFFGGQFFVARRPA